LGLRAVDEMSEDPTATGETLAETTLTTESATPAGADARDKNPIAGNQCGDCGAHRLDGADGLMPENPAVGDLGHVALQYVEVRTADGRAVDPHQGVGVVADLRGRDIVPGLGSRSVVDECSHGVTLI